MKIRFSYIMLILALSVAGCAGYFSVWGLSQLFAGASTAVIIMATVLEVGKVVTTTALHRYWSKLAKGLKGYLTVSVVVLMIITSAGIYGFLSNAYQSTANKLELHEGEVAILDGKKAIFEKNISDNQTIIDSKNKRVDQLTSLRLNQEARLDSAKTIKAKDKVRNDILIANTEIQSLSNEIDELNDENIVLSDSVGVYSIKILEAKSNSDVAAEIGPLKYISELTNQPMAKVVNYLILLLIFVFDPLAIALVLITNKVFQIEKEIKEEEKVSLPIEIKEVDDLVEDEPEIPVSEDINDESINNVIEEPVSESIVETPVEDEIVPKAQEVEDLVPISQVPEEQIQQKPVEQTKKVRLEDIKEIKESNRGYSVNVPPPKQNNNIIERIGANKMIKNGDNNKVIFKRGQ